MDNTPVAWTAMPYRAPVLDSGGGQFGTAESLLGDEGADIFHGIAVKLGGAGHIVELPAAQVTLITRSAVHTSLAPGSAAELTTYQEERWYHLGWGGLFRKHPDWKEGE